jgi:hypothetical protein
MTHIYENKETKVVCWKIEKLKSKYKEVINWKYNRKPDNTRIQMIKEYMEQKTIDLVPGLICAWEIQNRLEIYDGFHRFSACKDFNNCKIIIKITKTEDEEIIKKDFELVNKSVYVPAMYLETNQNKNEVCNNVYEMMKNQFPENISFSNSPHKQNFSKNSIVELLHRTEIDFSEFLIENKIFLELIKINNEIKNLGIKPRYKKTSRTGFWLLLWDNDKIIERLNDLNK